VHQSLFYCVANMPGAVPNTSTHALVNATLPYTLELANRGWKDAVARDAALAEGVNVAGGHLTSAPVAEAHGLRAENLANLL
jgi:alanine dehydrogenase